MSCRDRYAQVYSRGEPALFPLWADLLYSVVEQYYVVTGDWPKGTFHHLNPHPDSTVFLFVVEVGRLDVLDSV